MKWEIFRGFAGQGIAIRKSGGDLDRAEAVALVERLDAGDILIDQLLAERTVAVQRCWLDRTLRRCSNQRRAEILIAGDADRVDDVPLTQLNRVERGQVLRIGCAPAGG